MPLAGGIFSLPFSGADIDRAAHIRKSTVQLRSYLEQPSSKVLVVREMHQVPVGGANKLAWLAISQWTASERERLIFLGLDLDGTALFSIDDDQATVPMAKFIGLREVALDLDPVDAAAAVEAVALVTWHRRAPYCPTCGAVTVTREAGHQRRCTNCQIDHFPRSDAAVIMLVSDGDRCVLGRRIGSLTNRWSTLAGFVEVGESPEGAVVREVFEEVGLRVDYVRYRGSQPWPFPASLMLAFEAHAPFAELSINEEHSEVRWFTRAELRANFEDQKMVVPSKLSAGGHLIMDWLTRE